MAYAPLDVAVQIAARLNLQPPVAYGDNTPLMNTFRALWQNGILVPVLRDYGWNCCKKRAALSQPSLNVTAGSYNAPTTTVTLTIGAHTLQVGQKVYVNGILPADWNGTFTISAVTGTTISFVQSVVDAYSSGGVVTWSALMDWGYVYSLPTDYVRVMRLQMIGVNNYYDYSSAIFKSGQTTPEFSVENGFLLTNYQVAQLLYVARDISVPPLPPNFDYMIDLLGSKGAAVMIEPLTAANEAKVQRFDKIYERTLMRAKIRDSQESTPPQWQEDNWITSRNA